MWSERDQGFLKCTPVDRSQALPMYHTHTHTHPTIKSLIEMTSLGGTNSLCSPGCPQGMSSAPVPQDTVIYTIPPPPGTLDRSLVLNLVFSSVKRRYAFRQLHTVGV